MYFPDGFRVKSTRELLLFRNYAEKENITLIEDDEALKKKIISSGFVLEEMVFVVSPQLLKLIREKLQEIYKSGAKIVFYEPLRKANREILETEHLYSLELFRDFLQNIPGMFFFSQEYFTFEPLTEIEAITSDILRIWPEDRRVMSIDEIFEYLPYIPLENIKFSLLNNLKFVKLLRNRYFMTQKFIISEEERREILDFVTEACKTDGYVSLVKIPCENVKARNYELWEKDKIYTVIFNYVLRKNFKRHNKIVFSDKSEIDFITLLKHYLTGKKECSFDELAKLSEELTGRVNQARIFQVLFENMVRVDAKKFISEDQVNFNIDKIDEVLDFFIGDKKFISVKSIITFAMFPDCGRKWNLFLLESFCYRFSRKYSLVIYSKPHGEKYCFNVRNIGFIAQKNISLSYNDLLAEVIGREDFQLTEKSVKKFLLDKGYVCNSKLKDISDIIKNSEKVRD